MLQGKMQKTYKKNKSVTQVYVWLGTFAYLVIIMKNNPLYDFHTRGVLLSVPLYLGLLIPFLSVRIRSFNGEFVYFNPLPKATPIKQIREVRAYGELALSRMTKEVDQVDIVYESEGDLRKIGINAWLFLPETFGELFCDLRAANPSITFDSRAHQLMEQYEKSKRNPPASASPQGA